MKYLFSGLFSMLLFSGLFSMLQGENIKMDKRVFLADPFILCENGKYYAFGTGDSKSFKVYISDDLKKWKLLPGKRNGAVMTIDDVWGEKWLWAPEVYKVNGEYIMYFTGDVHISCAVSSSITGPFVQSEKKPMCENENRIDNTLFIDDDGQGYVFFNRWGQNGGSEVWGAKLEKDYKTIKEDTLFRVLGAEEPWETIQDSITEGPFMIKHSGKYYITYTANNYKSKDYAVGYAVADKPEGPFVKAAENPILRRPGNFVGSGHHSFFKDKDGKLRIVFHVHYSEKKIQPRFMVIGEVFFENGKMKIGKEFIIPELMEK